MADQLDLIPKRKTPPTKREVLEALTVNELRQIAEHYGLLWRCPHCGSEVVQSDDEPAEAGPACCYCRAEFLGITPAELRQLAVQARQGAPWPAAPPASWTPRRKAVG